MRPFLRTRFDQGPLIQIELLFFPQEFLRAAHGFLFGQRSAGRLFGKSMPERVQRPVRPQDHRELLRLAVAEITHAPEGAWNARVINSVRSDLIRIITLRSSSTTGSVMSTKTVA